jgi:hypothetical protein
LQNLLTAITLSTTKVSITTHSVTRNGDSVCVGARFLKTGINVKACDGDKRV